MKKIVGIFVCMLLICTVLPISANVILDRTYVNDLFQKDVLVSFNIYEKSDIENRQVMLSSDEVTVISDLFEKLQYAIIHNPNTDETENLKSRFIGLLDKKGLLPDGISNDEVIELLNPSFIHGFQQNKLMSNFLTSLKISASQGSSFFCSIASGGTGKTTPIAIGPRPHAIVLWKGTEGEELTITTVGGLNSGKGFIASGNQNGMAIGFEGIGLTYGTPFGTVYGLTGYAIYASVTADYIDFYPPNSIPEISNPIPSNNQENIPTTLKDLSFRIQDDDNDLMGYSVSTDPFIGSGSKNNVGNGIYSISVNGLQPSTTYTWTVTVTDGKDTTTNIFSFTTILERPIVTDPIPIAGSSTTTDLSELSFKLSDAQGDKMDYTVQTSPDIGSSSATGVGDGTYSIQISKLKENIWYYWYVNVTDGVHLTKEKFSFYTGGLDLVGYWNFDEGNGIIAHDSSGNGNDGTIDGATWVDGVTGKALYFDGSNIVQANCVNPTSALTVSVWVKWDHFETIKGGCAIISNAHHTPMEGYLLYTSSGSPFNRFTCFVTTSTGCYDITIDELLNTNQWYHFVITYDGDKIIAYIDGKVGAENDSASGPIISTSNPLIFGKAYEPNNPYSKYFHGTMDEVRIYDRALSESDIQVLYIQGKENQPQTANFIYTLANQLIQQ